MEEILKRLRERASEFRTDKTSATDIFLRHQFLARCMELCEWLKGKSNERKNERLTDAVNAFDKLTKDYEELIGKLEFQENRADYFELLYESRAQIEREHKILIEKYTKLVNEQKKG